MTLPVCAVQCYVYTQDGDPEKDAIVSAKLNRYEVYQGHVVPELMTATTDASGLAVLSLWPNELGSTESSYKVTIQPVGKRSLTVYAVVPLAVEANLSDIATLPVYEGKPDGQLGVELANAALVAANNAVLAAAGSATTAGEQAGIATAQAGDAATSAGTATAQAGIATAQAVIATAQAGAAATSAGESAASAAAAVAALAEVAPPSALMAFARNTAPAGWLKANGAAVSRTTYADLFSAIGTVFGVGDGATTFNLPDMRGEFLRGWDDGLGVDSGRAFASSQGFAMQGHHHSVTDVANKRTVDISAGGGIQGTVSGPPNFTTSTPSAAFSIGNPTTDGVNGAPVTSAETRPRNVAMLYCIKY
jgi:microcystin-dependent protein